MKPEPPSGMICTCASFSLGVRISTMQAFINKRFSSSVACRLMQFNFMATLAGNVGFGIGFTARVAKVVISHNNIMALFIYHYTVGSTVHERHIGMSACVNGCQSRNGNSNEHKNGKDNCKNFFHLLFLLFSETVVMASVLTRKMQRKMMPIKTVFRNQRPFYKQNF